MKYTSQPTLHTAVTKQWTTEWLYIVGNETKGVRKEGGWGYPP